MIQTETHPAKVLGTDDPERRGRIRVACAGLMGDEETELPEWVEPAPSWGWFIVPDVGELVEIEVVVGSSEDEQSGQASIDNLDAKWRGARFYGNSEGEQPTPINEDFLLNYGKRRGFATPGGHTLIFDDTDGDRRINLTWTNENQERGFISFDQDGSFIVGTKTGHTMYFNVKEGELSIIDQHGNTYSSNVDGTKIINKDGDLIELKGGNIQILAQSGVTISCKDAVLDAGKVQIAGNPAIEALVLGTTFLALYNAHTHVAPPGGGPTSPPAVPMVPGVHTSAKAFAQ